jgi:uncharacterized protein (TIGR00255 family)
MIKSMTGFASLTNDGEGAAVSVTIRTLNHRFLDVQLRIPGSLAPIETRLRALVQRMVARGRVEVSVTVQQRRPPGVDVELNEAFLGSLDSALKRARELGLIAGAMTPGDLLRFPQALTIRDRSEESAGADAAAIEELGAGVEAAVSSALGDLDAMRAREGTYLRADLDARRAQIGDLFSRLAEAADQGTHVLQARLEQRVRELRTDAFADESLIAQEIAKFIARSDITEEVVRFRGHLDHWQSLTDSPEPCGRKLDFLLQEMNREVNTVASKAEGAAVSELIVALKAELEKMREQVQNVE